MIYQPYAVLLGYSYEAREAWKFYHAKFTPNRFLEIINLKADELSVTHTRWWMYAFKSIRAVIVLSALLILVTPRDKHVLSGSQIVLFFLTLIITLFACTVLESAKYKNDRGVAARKAILSLIESAEGDPLDPENVEKQWSKYQDAMSSTTQTRILSFLGMKYVR